jgi:4-diphosphocytidyl-2-C-methyl-D-erythritol kinase
LIDYYANRDYNNGIETLNAISYAKINLHLDVGSKRPDGFHEIYSFFKAISFHDEIQISIDKDISKKTKDKKFIKIKGKFSCSDENNLIYKAAIRFMENFDSYFSVQFNVNKMIPEGGGLGGGSSNAATVLKTLNNYFDSFFSKKDLKNIASSIGSDIPFFLEESTLALVTGRGDIVEPIFVDMPEYKLLLVDPGFKIKTSDAYLWLDNDRGNSEYNIEKIDDTMFFQYPSKWRFSNSFTEPLKKRFDIYDKIFSVLNDNGVDFYNITGSGSIVYGIFTDTGNLNKAYSDIKKFCPDIWITNTLAGRSTFKALN